jgi:hypothetical protein
MVHLAIAPISSPTIRGVLGPEAPPQTSGVPASPFGILIWRSAQPILVA